VPPPSPYGLEKDHSFGGCDRLSSRSTLSSSGEHEQRRGCATIAHIRESTSAEERSEPERKVDAADALLQETIEHLARGCPLPLLGARARESLEDLRPHVQQALDALEEIEGRRELTEGEFSRRHAFKMVLAARR
jgi:hypothetical protein